MKNLNFQKGSVSTEWVILTFIMVMVFFAPIPGSDQSLAGMMVEAIKGFYKNLSFLVSLP